MQYSNQNNISLSLPYLGKDTIQSFKLEKDLHVEIIHTSWSNNVERCYFRNVDLFFKHNYDQNG